MAGPVILTSTFALVFSLSLDERFASVAELSVGSSAFMPTASTGALDAHYLSSPAAPSTVKAMPHSWQAVVADRVARRLGRLSGAEVFESVAVAVDPDRRVLSVTATSRNPRSAARLANMFAEEYVSFERKAYATQVGAAREATRVRLVAAERSATGVSRDLLAQRRRELAVLASVGPPQLARLQAAHPVGEARSPNPVRNVLVALALGLLAGVGLRRILASRAQDAQLRTEHGR